LDLPVDIGLKRASDRSTPDRFEIEKRTFFDDVRNVYIQRAINEPERFYVVDASQSIVDVQQSIASCLDVLLNHE